MAAKPIDPSITEAVVTDWRLGQMSQRQLAVKHSISLGAVSNLCKGVVQDASPILNAGIQYNQSLMAQDERMVNAIETAVDVAVKRMEWLNVQALKNVKQAMEATCDSQNDYRSRADTISKAKDVVIGKGPETAIQINNNSEFKVIERTIVHPAN